MTATERQQQLMVQEALSTPLSPPSLRGLVGDHARQLMKGTDESNVREGDHLFLPKSREIVADVADSLSNQFVQRRFDPTHTMMSEDRRKLTTESLPTYLRRQRAYLHTYVDNHFVSYIISVARSPSPLLFPSKHVWSAANCK